MSTMAPPAVHPKGGDGVSTRAARGVYEDESSFIAKSYEEKRKQNPRLPPNLDFEELKKGVLRYKNLKGYKDIGLEVVEHRHEDPKKLLRQRNVRKWGTGIACGAAGISSFGLAWSSLKLGSNILFGSGDLDRSYTIASRSFLASSVAGLAIGASHENLNWGAGAAGMGILSGKLNKPWGLALFSIFDGINAKGMGEVKRRDSKNANPNTNRYLDFPDIPWLQLIADFINPLINAVKSFGQRFTTKAGWKSLFTDEPYSLYETASGSSISGSIPLAIGSLFSGVMNESTRSVFYLPYSLTSLVNLVALFRDGVVTRKRAFKMEGRDPNETKVMKVEGWSKAVAAPIIALNYLFLGLKGLGLDIKDTFEHTAMSLRSLGVAVASIGFAAQAGVKFWIDELFGPYFKEFFRIIIHPKIIMERHLRNVRALKEEETHANGNSCEREFFKSLIESDKDSELLLRIINSPFFQILKTRHLTGLPTDISFERNDTYRFDHSIGTCAIAILNIDSLINRTTDTIAKAELIKRRRGFIIGSLCHDAGHGKLPRCHLGETAWCGPKDGNDFLSIESLMPGSKIYNTVLQYNTEKLGSAEGKKSTDEDMEIARNVIGYMDPTSTIYKAADIGEYSRAFGSDYHLSFGFPYWTKEDYEYFANQRVAYIDENGDLIIGYAEEGGGAIIAFKSLFYRAVFNGLLNYPHITLAKEHAYKYGIQNNPGLTISDVQNMSDYEFDEAASEGAKRQNKYSRQIIRNIIGGRDAYCGIGNPKDRIVVVWRDENGNNRQMDFVSSSPRGGYLEEVLKYKDPELYSQLEPMARILKTPSMVEIELEMCPTTLDELDHETQRMIQEPPLRIFEPAAEPVAKKVA